MCTAGPSDFVSVSDHLLTLPAHSINGDTVCADIAIIGDTTIEQDVGFNFTFTVVNPFDALLGSNTGNVVILNDDGE